MRLFLALSPTSFEQDQISAATRARVMELGGRPLPPENLHLTLCFLGEVAESALPALCTAISQVPAPAVELDVGLLDYWKDARVLCLVPEPGPPLQQVARLAAALGEAVQAAGLGCDRRPFRAHITIGRRVAPQPAQSHAWPMRLGTALRLTTRGFMLMRSTAQASGSRYAVLQAWPAITRGS